NCERVTDFEGSLCVVPAVCYDNKGFRLGYGRGYYDRFLKNYISKSVGLCYNELLVDDLPVEEYDIPVGSVITD
ncbi:MAG: 5-formyltetrahydrofolate cyclo-ligase, partial [Eubacterium sp.]|nr:5-formyltetrahydrofolate cyclo-ligase [Eubacterium sp.]